MDLDYENSHFSLSQNDCKHELIQSTGNKTVRFVYSVQATKSSMSFIFFFYFNIFRQISYVKTVRTIFRQRVKHTRARRINFSV